jgi:hypothetical protein
MMASQVIPILIMGFNTACSDTHTHGERYLVGSVLWQSQRTGGLFARANDVGNALLPMVWRIKEVSVSNFLFSKSLRKVIQ